MILLLTKGTVTTKMQGVTTDPRCRILKHQYARTILSVGSYGRALAGIATIQDRRRPHDIYGHGANLFAEEASIQAPRRSLPIREMGGQDLCASSVTEDAL